MSKSAFVKFIIVLLLASLLFGIILLFNVRGPIIEVLNCNDCIITSSAVCCNENNYFYLSNNKIYSINLSEQSKLLNSEYKYDNIACNQASLFASSNNKLVKLDFNGNVIILKEEPYPIESLFSTDTLLVYTYGNIEHILKPDTLEDFPIRYAFTDSEKNKDYQFFYGTDLNAITQAPALDFNDNSFYGIFTYKSTVVNINHSMILGKNVIYRETPIGVSLSDFNENTIRNLSSDLDYRHVCVLEEGNQIVLFYSDYTRNLWLGIFNTAKYNKNHLGISTAYNLIFHSKDTLIIHDSLTNTSKEFSTQPGEIILLSNLDKVATYYKGNYYLYNLHTNECVTLAHSNIPNKGSYYVVSSGERIFVFNDNDCLVDSISLN